MVGVLDMALLVVTVGSATTAFAPLIFVAMGL
jgi:hypothetical protein